MEDGQLFKMKKINNWINGREVKPSSNEWLRKINPANEKLDSLFPSSNSVDVNKCIKVSQKAFIDWSKLSSVKRGEYLFNFVQILKLNIVDLAKCVARETGKTYADAYGEVGAAIAQGEFFAGEGRRLYSNSLNSAIDNKYCHTIREPHGVVGLIVPANTPIANIAWKIFPALICGNTVILKASEDAPEIAILLAKISKKSGMPDGIFNVLNGLGSIVGESIIQDNRLPLISFTGSTDVGKYIASKVGERMGRVSLELGGKNPFIVCKDADIDSAVKWAALSAFSNAGQRCAAASRIIVDQLIYKEFVNKLIRKTNSLKLGISKGCDLGPVINQKQYLNILNAIEKSKKEGGKVSCGGNKQTKYSKGFYVKPTLIENLDQNSFLFNNEIFGPVATIHKAKNDKDAINLANKTNFGLTAAVHTKSINRSFKYIKSLVAGTVNINSGTYGSEPHMPFGGFGESGNGTREPGTEALNVYTELKNISFLTKNS